ncbi:YjfB family protein [Bacillus sp. S/N-304-OC-R1]|uniref:YjfB family protein n=1 Tax=Bacillus sp. S/N-304-OC-R1 TaxID=2758034 RepID=UPI001C8E7C42|nr:YjfB family protein [Bacillus sp. S/N-304-OC-R1]MBY0123443.1 YjfB family protein [Bacillus sp. S/N-304-OC-R1]
MDIAFLSVALNQGQIQQQASISILKKAMDQGEGNADLLTKMLSEADVKAIQQAAQPHLGGNIDIKL